MGDDKAINLNCPTMSKFPEMEVKCSGMSTTETTNTFVWTKVNIYCRSFSSIVLSGTLVCEHPTDSIKMWIM